MISSASTFRPGGKPGQRLTLPTGGRFAPTQGRAMPSVSECNR